MATSDQTQTQSLHNIAQARTYEAPPAGEIYALASDYVARHTSHKARIQKYDAIVDGRWNTVWPDGTATRDLPKIVEHISGDTKDLINLVGMPEPGLAMPQDSDRPKDLEVSIRRQQIIYTYRRVNNLRRLRKQTVRDMVTTGLACWVIWPGYEKDPYQSYPRYIRKDPRIVYPDPSLNDPSEISTLVVRYVTKARILAKVYPQVMELYTAHERLRGAADTSDIEVVEFYDDKGCTKIVHRGARDARYRNRDTVLTHLPNYTGKVLAVIVAPESADGQFRGQFDSSIPPLGTANKMMEMHLAQMADQIFAEKIIRGQWDNPEDIGPGANLYTADYQANIERAETASSSQQLYQDIQLLVQASREAAGVPPARVGNVEQNIISGQGITALQGKFVTTVAAFQNDLADLEQRANERALAVDELYLDAFDKMLSGVVGGRSFKGVYTPSLDIAGQYENRVVYGPGAAVDAYNRSQMALNKLQYGVISRRFAMEQDGDVEDVAAMEAERAKEMALDGFLAGLADPNTDLATRAKAVAMLTEGQTVEEVAQAFAAEQSAVAAEQVAVEEVLGPQAQVSAGAPEEEYPVLPELAVRR